MTTKRKKPGKPRIIKNPERNARLRLKRRKPEVWLALLSDIEPADLRIQAASIIWWDYYSGREVVDGWPHLDGYLGAWTKDIRITPADLRAALVQCGYTPKLAKERVPDNHCQFREQDMEEYDHEIDTGA